jgi:hypothetical protein
MFRSSAIRYSAMAIAGERHNSAAVFFQIRHGLAGLLLIAVFWPLNWILPGFRTAYLFFPLWLGYILTVDALVLARDGTSLLARSRRDFVLLFAVSAPAWWLFEFINHRTQNWEYIGREHFTSWEYFVLCTISFSTVMPAIFETAELVRTFRWVARFAARRRFGQSARAPMLLFVTGLVMLPLLWIWPHYLYPFVWLSLAFILDPINLWLDRKHLLQDLRQGDWRNLISLSLGALICGFFWELWNYYSFPKWIYHTPGAQFLHIFEMPLLGFGGYIPFAWELHGLRSLLWRNNPSFRI